MMHCTCITTHTRTHLLVIILFFPPSEVQRILEGQQQRCAEAVGRRELHGSISVRVERQARQSRHFVAH